jgi:hypothetical protein
MRHHHYLVVLCHIDALVFLPNCHIKEYYCLYVHLAYLKHPTIHRRNRSLCTNLELIEDLPTVSSRGFGKSIEMKGVPWEPTGWMGAPRLEHCSLMQVSLPTAIELRACARAGLRAQ